MFSKAHKNLRRAQQSARQHGFVNNVLGGQINFQDLQQETVDVLGQLSNATEQDRTTVANMVQANAIITNQQQ